MAAYFSKSGIISTFFAVINFLLLNLTLFFVLAADNFFGLEKQNILNLVQVILGVLLFSALIGFIWGLIPEKWAVANNIHRKIGLYFNFMEILMVIGVYLLLRNF